MGDPLVTVKNNSSHAMFIQSDPNWDDQILVIDDKRQDDSYELTPRSTIILGITYDSKSGSDVPDDSVGAIMGVFFSLKKYHEDDCYMFQIGQDPNLRVIDDWSSHPPKGVKYNVEDSEQLSMTLEFLDS